MDVNMVASAAGGAHSQSAFTQITRGYRFVDYATLAYLALLGVLIFFFHNHHTPPVQWLLPMHAGAIAVIHTIIRLHCRYPNRRVVSFFRHFYPLLLYAFLYSESELLNLMFVDRYLDPIFIAYEERIFGFLPAVAFMETLPNMIVSEFFYMAYFSYYVMIGGVGLSLFYRNRESYWHYLAIVSFVLYGCYLAFIFLPVSGPPAFYMEIPRFVDQHQLPYYPLAFPPAVAKGPFFQIMAVIYRNFESGGGAFPSSHVAVAICTLYFSYRYLPRIRQIHLAAVIAMCLATVYCRYHYAVDVVAGALTAVILIPLGELLYRRRS
jgi:membrane-associated phospholipid phosphatase